MRLDHLGLGHLRRFAQLAELRSGEWDGMGDGGLWLGVPERTFRYQLANMAYALAAVQYAVTPAYREFGQRTLRALITKLMEPDCWKEWINVSRGGGAQDPDQKELHVGTIDPLARWNIMYGGHLLHTAALYESLYAEGRYSTGVLDRSLSNTTSAAWPRAMRSSSRTPILKAAPASRR
jgi:hypothetical protein